MDDKYSRTLNTTLQLSKGQQYNALDLFAGCGGLALGFEAAGFRTHGWEKDADACATYRHNLQQPCEQVTLAADTSLPGADIVIGGPPCQPFSVGGHQRGGADARDGLPIFVAAIERIQPKLWLFENVRGLLGRNKPYLDHIIARLYALGYSIDMRVLNAVEYGVPQNRERLIVVGHRGGFSFPKPLSYRVTAGEALGAWAHAIPAEAKFLTASMDQYVANYERASCCRTPRDLHLDRPSRTVTCRNLAAPTGDMMRLTLPDGRRRRLLVREAARLQSFPDWFEFMGSETSQFYQLGNAVPPLLAYQLAREVHRYLEQTDEQRARPSSTPSFQMTLL